MLQFSKERMKWKITDIMTLISGHLGRMNDFVCFEFMLWYYCTKHQ